MTGHVTCSRKYLVVSYEKVSKIFQRDKYRCNWCQNNKISEELLEIIDKIAQEDSWQKIEGFSIPSCTLFLSIGKY